MGILLVSRSLPPLAAFIKPLLLAIFPKPPRRDRCQLENSPNAGVQIGYCFVSKWGSKNKHFKEENIDEQLGVGILTQFQNNQLLSVTCC